MSATPQGEPHEDPEDELLPLPITQENPSGDDVLGLDDDASHEPHETHLELDGSTHAPREDDARDLADLHADVMLFDDDPQHAAEPERALDVPEEAATFDDRARRSSTDDEPRDDDRDLEAFVGEERSFDDGVPARDRADRGVEGLIGEDVELDEASLPAMDADQGGEFDLSDLLSELGFGAAREFVAETVHDVGPLSAMAMGHGGMCAGGTSSVFFQAAGGAVELRRWPRPVTQIERAEDGFVIVDTEAVSHVGVSQGALRSPTVRVDGPVDQLVVVGDQVVIRIGSEVQLVQPSGERVSLSRDAASIGATSSTLIVATLRGSLETRRGHDGAITEHPLDVIAASAFASHAEILVCGPRQCLVRGRSELLWVRMGGPTQRLSLAGDAHVSAACPGDLGFDFLVVLEDASRTLLAAPHAPSSELHILADLTAVVGARGTKPGGVRVIQWESASHEGLIASAVGVVRVRAVAPH